MITQIKTWGNSQGLRFSKDMLESCNIKVGDYVNVESDGTNIIIKKTFKHMTLEERLEKAGLNEMPKYEEFDWGSPVGREFW